MMGTFAELPLAEQIAACRGELMRQTNSTIEGNDVALRAVDALADAGWSVAQLIWLKQAIIANPARLAVARELLSRNGENDSLDLAATLLGLMPAKES